MSEVDTPAVLRVVHNSRIHDDVPYVPDTLWVLMYALRRAQDRHEAKRGLPKIVRYKTPPMPDFSAVELGRQAYRIGEAIEQYANEIFPMCLELFKRLDNIPRGKEGKREKELHEFKMHGWGPVAYRANKLAGLY